jgi:hypothetical protein
MDEYTRNLEPAKRPATNSSNWWKWLLGILAICICLGCAGTVSFFLYFAREPENLLVNYSMPSTVSKSENFDLVITLTNTGSEAFTVDDIDLDESLGGSILDGAVVLETEPYMERDYSVSGIKTFVYERPLEPGETKQVIFHLQATTAGEFGGSIGVYVSGLAKRIDYVGLIVQE